MVRSEVVQVRFSTEERDQLKMLAEEKGITMSQVIRHAALGLDLPKVERKEKKRRIPKALPEINKDLYRELARIGNNVNQIARACNEARQWGSDPPVTQTVFDELLQAIKAVGKAAIDL